MSTHDGRVKPKTPYQHLLEDIQDWARTVAYRHEVLMWRYPKARLTEGWTLNELYERVTAAEQLGYDVQLRADDDGLLVYYKKKVPDVPYNWKY